MERFEIDGRYSRQNSRANWEEMLRAVRLKIVILQSLFQYSLFLLQFVQQNPIQAMPPPSIVKPHVRPPARGGSRPAAMTTKRPAAALPKSAASKPATLPVIVKKPTNLATLPDVVNPNKRAAATAKKVDDKHKSTVLIGLVTTTSMGCWFVRVLGG